MSEREMLIQARLLLSRLHVIGRLAGTDKLCLQEVSKEWNGARMELLAAIPDREEKDHE